METKEVCPHCGKKSDSVSERPNAYAQEINDEQDATWIACDECDEQNRLDI